MLGESNPRGWCPCDARDPEAPPRGRFWSTGGYRAALGWRKSEAEQR